MRHWAVTAVVGVLAVAFAGCGEQPTEKQNVESTVQAEERDGASHLDDLYAKAYATAQSLIGNSDLGLNGVDGTCVLEVWFVGMTEAERDALARGCTDGAPPDLGGDVESNNAGRQMARKLLTAATPIRELGAPAHVQLLETCYRAASQAKLRSGGGINRASWERGCRAAAEDAIREGDSCAGKGPAYKLAVDDPCYHNADNPAKANMPSGDADAAADPFYERTLRESGMTEAGLEAFFQRAVQNGRMFARDYGDLAGASAACGRLVENFTSGAVVPPQVAALPTLERQVVALATLGSVAAQGCNYGVGVELSGG